MEEVHFAEKFYDKNNNWLSHWLPAFPLFKNQIIIFLMIIRPFK